MYLLAERPPATAIPGKTPGPLTADDIAFLHDPRPAPTLFDSVLYASDDPAAYNTLLITAAATAS